MNNGDIAGIIIMYVLFGGLTILVSALIMRAIFRINTITNNLIEQTNLLKSIAETQKQILKNQQDKNSNQPPV